VYRPKTPGQDLRLADLLDAQALGSLPLGSAAAADDPHLRAAIAATRGGAP
jgi:hypothetical protein